MWVERPLCYGPIKGPLFIKFWIVLKRFFNFFFNIHSNSPNIKVLYANNFLGATFIQGPTFIIFYQFSRGYVYSLTYFCTSILESRLYLSIYEAIFRFSSVCDAHFYNTAQFSNDQIPPNANVISGS